MLACYAEGSYKVLSLVIITYGREDLKPSTLFITMLVTDDKPERLSFCISGLLPSRPHRMPTGRVQSNRHH